MSKLILAKDSFYKPEVEDGNEMSNEFIFFVDYIEEFFKKLLNIEIDNRVLDGDAEESFRYGASLKKFSNDTFLLGLISLREDNEGEDSYDFYLKVVAENKEFLICEYERVLNLV